MLGMNPTGGVVKYNKWGARILFRGLYNQFSPCSDTSGDVGNLTLTYSLEADASRSSGHAVIEAGSWTDSDSGSDVEIENAVTLNIKWLIKAC